MKFFENINNLMDKCLFPNHIKCILCDEELAFDSRPSICEKCLSNLPFSTGKVCQKCGEQLSSMSDYCLSCKTNMDRNFTKAFAPFIYKDDIVKLIHDLKYNNKRYLGKHLSYFLVDEYSKHNFSVDIVVPIPLNKNRLAERGFNQSELLSECFKTQLNLPVDTTNLIRVADTPTQTNLSKKERMTNLKNAFLVADKSVFKNKKILLIDDVFTTGATMEEASGVLLKAGAKEIYCISLAHVKNPLSTESKTEI